jgi:hypothetical protein
VDGGNEPIDDDEFLYRRIPTSMTWYSPDTGVLLPEAFAPSKDRDLTGLSVARSKYKTVEEAAKGRPGKSYYVAILKAKDLKDRGIEALPRPQPNDPGHAELPDLNAQNRKSNQTLELERVLVELTLKVEGPFATPSQ